MQLVASGALSSPVASIPVALPTGYSWFRLTMVELQCSGDDILAAAFSDDGGATHYNDVGMANTYKTTRWQNLQHPTSNEVNALVIEDSLAYLYPTLQDQAEADGIPGIFDCVIFPGSAWRKASILTHGGGGEALEPQFGASYAVLQASLGRMNFMTILPFNLGDMTPGDNEIVGGTWHLYGAPTPT